MTRVLFHVFPHDECRGIALAVVVR